MEREGVTLESGFLVRVLGRPGISAGADRTTSELRGGSQRSVLALLVANRGRDLPRTAIEAELWPDGVAGASSARVTIARLRRRFDAVAGVDPIRFGSSGYRIELRDDELDAERFHRRLDDAERAWRAGDVAGALRSGDLADRLWAGDPYEGVDLPSVVPEQTRLTEARHDLIDLLAAGLLATGETRRSIELCERATDLDPARASTAAVRMAALHASGGRVKALAAGAELDTARRGDPTSAMRDLIAAVEDDRTTDEVVAAALRVVRPMVATLQISTHRRPDPTVDEPKTSTPGPAPPGEARFSGRAAELDVARLLVRDGAPRVWVVQGPTGIGKTRLASEVVRMAEEAGLPVLRTSCPRDIGLGLVTIRRLVEGALPHVDPTTLGRADVGAVLATTFPSTLGLATSQPTDRTDPSEATATDAHADLDLTRLRIVTAVEQVIASVPPALIVIDDLHRAGPVTASLVGHLATDDRHRWLVLASTSDRRPDAAELLTDLARAGAVTTTLAPLAPHEIVELVRSTAPTLDAHAVRDVVDRSEGHPLLGTELARHLSSGGSPEAIPGGIRAVVGADIDRVGPAAARLAEVAAVAGDPLPVSVLATAAGLTGREASAALDQLLARHLVVTDARRRTAHPSNDLTRAVLLERLTDLDAEEIHRTIADRLGGTADAEPILVLRHLLTGRDPDVQRIERVAHEAFAGGMLLGAPADAAALGDLLLARCGTAGHGIAAVETRLRIAAAHRAAGNGARAETIARAQQDEIAALGDPVLEATSLLVSGPLNLDRDDVRDRWRRGEAVLTQLPPERRSLRNELACCIALDAALVGALDRAGELLDLVEREVGDQPSADRGALLFTRVALAMDVAAPPDEADRFMDLYADNARAIDHREARSTQLLHRIERSVRTGTLADVTDVLDQADEFVTPIQPIDIRWWVKAARAGHQLACGDLVAAGTSYLEALNLGVNHSLELAVPTTLVHRFVLDRELGTLGVFHALLGDDDEDGEDAAALAAVHVSLAAEDRARAEAIADRIARPGLIAGAEPGRWPVISSLAAEAAWRLGHPALGAIVLDELSERGSHGLTSIGLCYLGSTDLARAYATAARRGPADEAIDAFHWALEREIWFGSPVWVARAARDAATVHDRRGFRGDGREAARLRRRAELADEKVTRST